MKTALKASLTGAASAVFLLGCANLGADNTQPPKLKAATPAALQINCADVAAKFSYANLRITSSDAVAAGALATSGASNAPKTAYDAPAHCLVKGLMHERKGIDGQDYAIGFEMRLPNVWNGRFYHQVNGGIDGVVQVALGALGGGPLTGALAQGFAVISSDAGHNGRQNPKFGEEPTARSDYGYGAVGKLTPMAKSLIGAAYGKAPDRSYIGGCSNGGRHAMVAASRYAEHYDGYLVGAPGYRLPNAALAQLWAGPLWLSLATKDATLPHPFIPNAKIADLGSGFTPQERMTVANSILDKCDALDGAKDGIVQDVAACQASFSVNRDIPNCNGDTRTGQCLTVDQKRVLSLVQAGAKTPSGEFVYNQFPFDTGMGASNWAQWKFVESQTRDPAAGYIFMSPTRTITPFQVDVGDGFKSIYTKTDRFKESADDVISAPVKDKPELLSTLRTRGAKMLMYHGVSDAIFSETDTRVWVDRVNAAYSGKAADFVRHFSVPGMAHCSGGPAIDQFDPLTPLVQWVEQGIAPASIKATARGAGNAGGVNTELPKDWSANRSRPLCAYPTVARYKGSGSLEDAASFSCQ
jgi:Tannase and feruloyl esterase